jgi:hypothetical protein
LKYFSLISMIKSKNVTKYLFFWFEFKEKFQQICPKYIFHCYVVNIRCI